MPGEYEHVADPYRRHQSLQALAESVGILTSSPSDSVVASPSLQNVVDHAATSENGTSAPAASSSSGSSSLHAFFTLLFLLVLLQSIVWLAQKVYARSMHAKRFEKGGGAVLQNFAFLSAAAPAFARYGTAFGFLLGVISMAVVQWLHSPDMIAHTLGTQPTVQHPTQHSAVQALTTTTQCEPKIIHVAAQCPTCPAPDTAVALVPSSAEHECARITDLSPGHEPIHFQPTYADVPLYPIDCDWQEGKWVERQGGLPKWFTEVDRWQMFGPQAKGKDLKHVFQPPSECKGSFREFDPKKFLKALEGKTIAFLGDSMIRQLHGVITSLLYEEVLGHTLYYPKVSGSGDDTGNFARRVHRLLMTLVFSLSPSGRSLPRCDPRVALHSQRDGEEPMDHGPHRSRRASLQHLPHHLALGPTRGEHRCFLPEWRGQGGTVSGDAAEVYEGGEEEV
jgi:hypothetical protein